MRSFESTGTVALAWVAAPGLQDAGGLDRAAIIASLRPVGAAAVAAAEAFADDLIGFRDEMRTGDIVVTVDAESHQLLVGETTGGYEHRVDDGTGRHHHIRPVEWYGRYQRDDRTNLTVEMEALTHVGARFMALVPVEAWTSFAAGVRERPPVPAVPRVVAPPKIVKPAPKPKITAAEKRAAAAALAAKPVVPTHRRCPLCQMQLALSQFRAGSDYCVDCRERRGED